MSNRTVPMPAALLMAVSGLVLGFVIGQKTTPTETKIVTADKGAVLLEAILKHPNASSKELQARVEQPITTILKHYSDNGYLVLNTTKDDEGNICIDAFPKKKLPDITQELRNAVQYQGTH